MVDIIIFAIIAIVIAIKFYNLLGTNEGKQSDNIVSLSQENYKNVTDAEEKNELDEAELKKLSIELQKKVEDIKKINGDFSLNIFVKGAEKAFEIIINAFLQGDKKLIAQLSNEEVTDKFINEYQHLKKAENKLYINIVAIISSNVIAIKLNKNIANITVEFTSEQISYLEDKENKIVSGDKNKIEEIEDKWIFSKDISNNSPAWQLVKTS